MISVRKFLTIVIITISLSFSLLAYADTYWAKGNKVKDKDGTEYLIFNDEHKVQLGFKVDGANLVLIGDPKNDSIKRETKKKEEAVKKKIEEKKHEKYLNDFVNNLLKLSMTLFGVLIIIVISTVLLFLVCVVIGFFYLKKR